MSAETRIKWSAGSTYAQVLNAVGIDPLFVERLLRARRRDETAKRAAF
jgi:hypothetical protein